MIAAVSRFAVRFLVCVAEEAEAEEAAEAEEIEALMDLLEEIDQADARIIPECSFDESWIDVCDWDTVSNINCGDWS